MAKMEKEGRRERNTNLGKKINYKNTNEGRKDTKSLPQEHQQNMFAFL